MFSLRPSVPKYTGPYAVGSSEYEIPISELDTESSPEDPRVTTLKFRLFYPTNTAYNGQTIPWVPSPQKQWTEAFGRFLGTSLGWSSAVNHVLSLMTYITIPAILNAPVKPRKSPYPLLIFSHGLAGNCNTYSSLCGSLASCGVVVAAVEHRDGSCPVSMVRDANGQIASEIEYRKYSHNPTPDVFNARNSQLRMRLWELNLLYTALGKLNAGDQLKNYATVGTKVDAPVLKASMDFTAGRVTWAGHSFGACTMVQFVKSVYYHHALPSLKGTSREHDSDWQPLFTPQPNSDLIKQITHSSPVTLLDVWTMPFRAPSTQWLWEKPMPCHDATQSSTPISSATTIGIISTEFYKWTDLLNRTRILLSSDPMEATEEISQQSEKQGAQIPDPNHARASMTPTLATPPDKHVEDDDSDNEPAQHDTDLLPPATLPLPTSTSPAEPIDRSTTSTPTSQPSSTSTSPADSSAPSPASSTTSLSPSLPAKAVPTKAPAPTALYHIPHSAHLSQSDFGPIFPFLTRMLMKAVDAQGIMQLNVRAIGQVMRNAGVEGVERVDGKSAGWFGGWFGRADATKGGVDGGSETESEEVKGERERALFDDILEVRTGEMGKGMGSERWRRLDVPLVPWV